MTRIRVRGFQIFKDRHGRLRCYHRASRTPIDLERHPIGSAGFFSECERIRQRTEAAAPTAGTLGHLVAKYRASQRFQELAPRTRADYTAVLEYLRPIEQTRLDVFTPALVTRIVDKASEGRGYRFGRYVRQVLSIVFAWGTARGFVGGNPATAAEAPKRPKGLPRANRPWTHEERDVVLDAAPPHLRVPLALMAFTGIDPGDAVRLTRQD